MKCSSPEYSTTAIVDALDLRARQPVDGGVEEHVLASGQLRVEPDAELDHRRDPRVARDQQPAAGRPVDRGDQLQERALARAVAADQADRFAAVDLQRDVLERPELLDRLALSAMQQAEEADLQLDRRVVPEQELLRHRCASMTGTTSCSVNRSSNARNSDAPMTKAPSGIGRRPPATPSAPATPG